MNVTEFMDLPKEEAEKFNNMATRLEHEGFLLDDDKDSFAIGYQGIHIIGIRRNGDIRLKTPLKQHKNHPCVEKLVDNLARRVHTQFRDNAKGESPWSEYVLYKEMKKKNPSFPDEICEILIEFKKCWEESLDT